MPRKTYQRTDETFKVLSDHESAIAREMEVDLSYINKIKNGVETDRFPQFREIFRAACYAGAPAEIWLNSLNSIYVKSRATHLCPSELSAKMLEKISDDAKALTTLASSLSDGKIEEHECHAILGAMAKNEATNSRIKTLVQLRLGEITEAKGKTE